jgi:Orsellinic acid/F9775 biosynthesis cluster protein D
MSSNPSSSPRPRPTSLQSTALQPSIQPTSLQSTALQSSIQPISIQSTALQSSIQPISIQSTALQSSSIQSTSLILSNNFSIYQEASSFREKETFIEIEELGFLSYYRDFKLLLCSECFLAINPTSFQSHIARHIKLYTKQQRESIISRALLVYSTLEVSSLKESLDLIKLFTKYFNLQAFKELKVLDLFLCNRSSTCSIVLSSEYSIKRHIRESHSTTSPSPSPSPYKVIKGQALEINKFYFEIKPRTSLIPSTSPSSRASSRSRSSSPRQDTLQQAKEAFIASLLEKNPSLVY